MPVSIRGRGSAGSVVVTPSLRASHSTLVPCRIVDRTTAKKTMLKNSLLCSMFSITGKVASTTGTAPRRPAQPTTTRSPAVKRSNAVASAAVRGRAMKTSKSASAVPSSQTSSSLLGNTSSPRARNIAIWATQPRPWWKTVTVCLAGMRAEPSIRPAR